MLAGLTKSQEDDDKDDDGWLKGAGEPEGSFFNSLLLLRLLLTLLLLVGVGVAVVETEP